ARERDREIPNPPNPDPHPLGEIGDGRRENAVCHADGHRLRGISLHPVPGGEGAGAGVRQGHGGAGAGGGGARHGQDEARGGDPQGQVQGGQGEGVPEGQGQGREGGGGGSGDPQGQGGGREGGSDQGQGEGGEGGEDHQGQLLLRLGRGRCAVRQAVPRLRLGGRPGYNHVQDCRAVGPLYRGGEGSLPWPQVRGLLRKGIHRGLLPKGIHRR
uniref:Uncharacterized protein n=1 Tax=Aegilops tauschii subsp. strangulata TaxID=200361 RepID=A0A453M6W4_AEGTS